MTSNPKKIESRNTVNKVKELIQDTREDKVRKRDRDINSISLYMGEVKLVAFFFARDGFHSFSLVVESKVSLNSC